MTQKPEVPAFSVVIPTHERPELVKRAVRSVLAQSFTDFELLVVDDASGPATAEAVGGFGDPRLRFLRLEKNGGPAAARNLGVERAAAPWLAFLDDDDELEPDFLAEVERVTRSAPEDLGFLWTGVYEVRDAEDGAEVLRERLWREPREPIGSMSYGVVVRRAAFDRVGRFDETLWGVEDTDLLFRLAGHCGFTAIERLLVRRHHHPGAQLIDPSPRRLEALERFGAKHRDYLESEAQRWRNFCTKVAALAYRLGERGRGRLWLGRLLRRQPWRPTNWKSLLFFEVFGTEALGLRQRWASFWHGGLQ